jgi:predicted RNA-binding protein with PIN domain
MASGYRETVIDGYNLIHKIGKAGTCASMAALRERLEAKLSQYRQKTRRHVTLVYDGGSSPKSLTCSGAIDVIFSGAINSADRWIINHVRSLGPRAGMSLVVSSDREIQRNSIAWGARCIDSETFIDELAAMGIILDERKKPTGITPASGMKKNGSAPIDDNEVDYWLRLFGRKS